MTQSIKRSVFRVANQLDIEGIIRFLRIKSLGHTETELFYWFLKNWTLARIQKCAMSSKQIYVCTSNWVLDLT